MEENFASLDTKSLRKFSELETRKSELETELNKIKNEINAMAPRIIENLASEGVSNIKIGGRTIFTKQIIFANIKSKEEAIKALREAGLNDYVVEGYNTNSVSAYIRELIRNDEKLPEAFGSAITAGEKITLHSVKSE